MNRTKKIYFLAAFVMIIGCYALNKSYSLFVETKEQDAVTSKVPVLESSLSIPTITLSSNEECLIKQTINNTSDVPINYSLSSTGTNYEIKLVDDTTNTALGTVNASTTKDIYLYIKNNSTEENTITFNLNKKYITLNNDLTTNITDTYTVTGDANPYSSNTNQLNYKILNNYLTSDLYNGDLSNSKKVTVTELSNLFKTESKISLPISSYAIPRVDKITDVETEEKGLFQTEDDYGTSYYYRGASTRNYVTFANLNWRIVRINGDGTIRLILEDSDTSTTFRNIIEYDEDGMEIEDVDDNAYVGYMYGLISQNESNTDQCVYLDETNNTVQVDDTVSNETSCLSKGYKWAATPYDATHVNIKDSKAKQTVDSWYETNLTEYTNYLADGLFCGDKTLSMGEGFGSEESSYFFKYDEYIINNTLECAKNQKNNYSRYTSSLDSSNSTNKGVEVNNDLKYPIGLISAEEVLLAGAYTDGKIVAGDGIYTIKPNKSFYLYNDTLNNAWWTMTPSSYHSESGLFVYDNEEGVLPALVPAQEEYLIRPVINLKSTTIVQGDGTKDNPYVVQ